MSKQIIEKDYEIGSRVDRRTAQPADFVYRSVCPFFDESAGYGSGYLAEDRFFYDKGDPENYKRFHEWIAARDELTEKLRAALNTMFRDSYKSESCQNLIDIWRVLRHLQYNIFDSIDKSLYDVRASEPYHGGTEPLMRIRILEKLGVAGGERLGEKNNNIV